MRELFDEIIHDFSIILLGVFLSFGFFLFPLLAFFRDVLTSLFSIIFIVVKTFQLVFVLL